MLAHRVASALVLLAALIAALKSSTPWPWMLLITLMTAAAAWEWARLTGYAAPATYVIPTGFVLVVAITMFVMGGRAFAVQSSLWWLVSVTWIVMGGMTLWRGVPGWVAWPRAWRMTIGVLALLAVWWALVLTAADSLNFLMSVLMVVWTSDVAAYFGGKSLGGKLFGARKLAPSISPGKTWEGALSGALGAMLLAWVWVRWVDTAAFVDGPSLFSRLVSSHGWGLMLLAVLLLVVMGIVGDLVESMVKRAAGAKDSSRLLPGHGGVLDRVDALLPVVPMAWAFAGQLTSVLT
jgi:phosphatidate cytidylyltransferase